MKQILEIGCGQGFYSSVLAKSKNVKVTGVDLSKEDIGVAKKRYPNIGFNYMNAEKLKFKENIFDKVFALDVLEHVDNIEKVISEVGRVTKKKGIFCINVPSERSENWLLKIRPSYFKEIHHVRIFKNNEMENLLKKYGFKLIKKKRRGFLQHLELYYLFTRKDSANNQLSIGDWRGSIFSKYLHIFMLYFDPIILQTPLKYFPLWLLTLPLGFIINSIGNKFFPKSIYYEFEKFRK